MESIILITGTAGLLPTFEKQIREALPEGEIGYQGDLSGFYVQNKGSDRLYVDDDGTNIDESYGWPETEWVFIKQHYPNDLHVYSIRYRVLATIKKAIAAIADSETILVDNDFGTLMVGKDFVQKMQAEPTWNWFNDLRDDQ